jgi:hypothetical protein
VLKKDKSEQCIRSMAHLNPGVFDYHHLRGLNGDVFRAVSAANQAQTPWTIKNMLPSALELWVEKDLSDDPRPFTVMQPQETREFPPDTFADRDQLYTYIRVGGKLFPFLRPYIFRDIWRTVHLGAVTYSSDGGHGEVQASHWNLRGIWLRNYLAFPLDVYYKGRLAVQLSAYNGIGYMGGGASEVYFDNDREGLNWGDEIEFSYSLPGRAGKNIFSVKIDDEQCLSMHIGVVSGGMWGPDPDNAVYRVDKPVHTGITFYVPAGGYRTRATNPLAPF